MKYLICLLAVIFNFNIHANTSPYVQKKGQEISALTANETQQLLNGEGMGFALSAELNEYPGPKHVIELSDSLKLNSEQLSQTKLLFSEMNQKAKVIGKTLIEQEQQLDSLFQTGNITAQEIQDSVRLISMTRAELRALHLTAHIQQRDLLSAEQLNLYQQLRGYGSDNQNHKNHSKSHQH